MTVEERQLRAWVRTVFRRAALHWLDRQNQQVAVAAGNFEEVMTWQYNGKEGGEVGQEDPWAVTTWWLDCLPRLTPRQRLVVSALYQGMTSTEIARMLQCDPRAIRRIIAHIRVECPL